MAATSLVMSPIQQHHSGGRMRKITVNERVEQILQGSLQIEDEDSRSRRSSHERDGAIMRSHQLSNLYSSSTEDKFVRTRVVAAQSVPKPSSSSGTPTTSSSYQQQRTRRVPPIALQHDKERSQDSQSSSKVKQNVITSPIKPVRCLSLQMLEQQQIEDASRAKQQSEDPVELSPVQPKPWYKGYSTSYKLPSCSLDAKVRRYGAYGTIKMIASAETYTGAAPHFSLNESQSLDSIAFRNEPSPWSPALHGSPTLWPEDANYAMGCKLEAHTMIRCPSPDFRFPTHSVGHVPEDAHLTRTKAIHAEDARVLEQLLDDEKALRKREIAYNRSRLETWQRELHFEPLSSKMDHPFVKVNRAKRAKQVTILHTPAYSPASKYNLQVQKLTDKRFALRWRNMAILLDVMRRTPCRRPVLQDVEKLVALAYELSHRNANPYELTREQFWEIMQKEYPGLELRHGNRLFSSYDFKMEDRLDLRVFFGTIRALRVQQGMPIEILCLSLMDFDTSKRGVVTGLEHFVAAFSLCCGDESEEKDMETQATALWKKMAADFKLYQQQQQHGHHQHDGAFSTPSTTEREAYQSSAEDGNFYSIQYVRLALQNDRHVLAFYSEMLLKRREECFKISIPPSR
ncbi:hypothetical protein Gpo141_00010582 [Globisporangium polare]